MKTLVKKFSASELVENQEQDQVYPIETTELQVEIKDADGNVITDETELTEDQVAFCSKVAYRKFKAFSASKVRKFNAETDKIEVTIPEELSNEAAEEAVSTAMEEYEAIPDETETVNPKEIEVEIRETDESDESEVEEFASRKTKKFNADELQDAIEEGLRDVNEDPEKAPREVEKFSAKAKANVSSAAKIINGLMAETSVANTKTAFFAAQRRK